MLGTSARTKAAAVGACLFAATSLAFLRGVVPDAPTSGHSPAVGALGGWVFAALSVYCALIVFERQLTLMDLESRRGRFFAVFEGSVYLVGVLLGLLWLVRRLLGDTRPPDEAEQVGAWLLGVVVAFVLLALVTRGLRWTRRPQPGTSPPTGEE